MRLITGTIPIAIACSKYLLNDIGFVNGSTTLSSVRTFLRTILRSLSHSISIGLLFDGTTFRSPLINFLIQTASIEASAATMYSAFVEDIAIVLYLALF
ncbi:hypothetical protein Tco_0677911 [Tanacetum coccineum]|uniref:Uncharacterized protein n=1 Tax=Tanacetum coccineum TaxID=301880 RepID=A0ABQ4XDH7_9ASTR